MRGKPVSRRVIVGALVVLGCLVSAPRSADGQDGEREPSRFRSGEAPEWGTGSWSIHQIAAAAFTPQYFDQQWEIDLVGYLFRTSGNNRFLASVSLPSGVSVVRIEADACDESDTLSFRLQLIRYEGPGTVSYIEAELVTGAAATDSCQWFFEDLGPPMTVDNYNNSYYLWTSLGAGGDEIRLRSVNIYYQLQISPAPATATFADVPVGFWASQHVEALAASGITAGCGGGNFCPDAPLTRAQMAVFLAKALGLHWPDL